MKKGKAITFILLAMAVGVAAAVVLKYLDKKQQKPMVLGAAASLASELWREEYRLDQTYNFLQKAQLSGTGELTIRQISADFFDERYRFLLPYLKNSHYTCTLQRDIDTRRAEFQLGAELRRTVELEGYLDDTECIVHIPAFHKSYLSFSPDNLKGQYESSLLYTVLGDAPFLPEDNLTEYVFFDIWKKEEKSFFAILKDSMDLARELYPNITVEKTDRREEIFWNGAYEKCTVYDITVPSELMNRFFQSVIQEKTGYLVQTEEDALTVSVCLNGKKRLLKLETEGTLLIDQKDQYRVPLSLAFYPKGADRPWDEIRLELSLTWDQISYGFRINGKNEFSENGRTMTVNLAMEQPYVLDMLDIAIDFDTETGEVSLAFDCTTPVLSLEGSYGLSLPDSPIKKPEVETVRVFELNFFEMLKFTGGLNLKKQE